MESSRGRAKVAWTSVCLPLEQGSFDFRELLSWNKTLLFQKLCETRARDFIWNDWILADKLGGGIYGQWCVGTLIVPCGAICSTSYTKSKRNFGPLLVLILLL